MKLALVAIGISAALASVARAETPAATNGVKRVARPSRPSDYAILSGNVQMNPS